MYKFSTLLYLLVGTYTLYAQQLTPYASSDPLYWKNRKPHAAYWQQDVSYKIDARIDEEQHWVIGSQQLHYVNNSPDTLEFVFFHLFQNAFVKNSYLRNLEQNNKVNSKMGINEEKGLGIVISDMKADGQGVKMEQDNTLLKVYLPKKLLPGASVLFECSFVTYWDKGQTRRRMKMYDAWGFTHYNGCQWFPKICVYDAKHGWDTYQHLGKEFYGNFGRYDVTLDFPSNYIVEATGELQNRQHVLPAELREKLDLKNFATKKWNEPPSIIIPYKKGERKRWHYIANHVHDFAFTADPTYRISTTYWNGIECVGLAQEPHAAGWQSSAQFVAKIIETFSTKIGMYAYPKMVAADAADGMEYPMLTLDGGAEPGYRSLLIHEIAHNWFYGMVGNNETYRAMLDEGFTQYLTAFGMEQIDGKYTKEGTPKNKLARSVYEKPIAREQRAFRAYYSDAINGEAMPINTHSDGFQGALGHDGGYRQVYYKTATMLYNLQLVLGDSLFNQAFSHYFNQWKMAHPYIEDFRASIIQFTKMDLNWFFDQWIETTKTLDYGICAIKKGKQQGSYKIDFVRKRGMQMPIDFTITDKQGNKQDYYIPNNWYEKKTHAITLPRWIGWDKVKPRYTAVVQVPAGIKHVQIDTSNRLADIYPLDNYRTKGLPISPLSIRARLDKGIATTTSLKKYDLNYRPDLWWNAVDGIKIGWRTEGHYYNKWHRFSAALWWNTHLLQGSKYNSPAGESYYNRYVPFNYQLSYASPFIAELPKLELNASSRFLDGLWWHRGGFTWDVTPTHRIALHAQTMWRPIAYDLHYLHSANEWSSKRALPNSSIEIAHIGSQKTKLGTGYCVHSIRLPFFTGQNANAFNYGFVQLDRKDYMRLGKIDFRTRIFGRYGFGKNIPYESALYLAGANPEQMMGNRYTRSIGIIPESVGGYSTTGMGNFQYGGGLNLRGYNGYLIGEERNGELLIGYKGRSGLSFSTEIDFEQLIKWQPKAFRNWLHFDVYAFADAGVIELSRVANLTEYWHIQPTGLMSKPRIDAGIGTAMTIKKFGVFNRAKPLTVRLDMPFFLNRPPATQSQYLQWRWLVGIERSF